MRGLCGFLFVTFLAQGADAGTASDLSVRAAQAYSQARYAEAEPLYRQAVEAWGQLGPAAARNHAVDLRNLGALLRATGRNAEAVQVLTDSLQELEATCGADSMEVSRALYNLAALYRAEGDLPKAETFAVRANDITSKRDDATETERQGSRLILASVYIAQRRFNEADTLLRSFLDRVDRTLAVAVYDNLANISIARGAYREAESFAREALQRSRLTLPASHPAIAAAWNNLAQACRFQGEYLEAEAAYREAIDIWESGVGPSHPDVARGLMNLGAFYHERGREAGAETLYQRAAAIFEQAFGRDDPRTLSARNELAEVLRAERRFTEASKLARTTLTGLEKALPADDPRVMRAQSNLARLIEDTKH